MEDCLNSNYCEKCGKPIKESWVLNYLGVEYFYCSKECRNGATTEIVFNNFKIIVN